MDGAAGLGFTVIVYDEGVPGQPFAVGVTVIVPDIGVAPELVAVNDGTLPVPLAANPIAVLEFVHENVPPAGELVNVNAETTEPLQTLLFAGTTAVGVGFTVIVYVEGVPVQPDNVGVIVIVPVIGDVVVLVAVNEGVLVVPLAARPIAALEFVQA